jgi:heme-degrading monooxygenase HmoA
MYAVVRHNTYDPAQLAEHGDALEAFDRLHREQPGFRGHLSIQAPDGSTIVVNVWDSEADAQSGVQVLGPVVQHTVEPLFARESVLLAAGPVVANDLLPTEG